MNIIFLTVSRIRDVDSRGIYADLMRKFRNEGHGVYIVTPVERQFGLPTGLTEMSGIKILSVRTLNIQKTNMVEKGLGTVLLETQFKNAIKKHFQNIRFDLILYSTPPITTTNVVRYLKRQNPNAVSYLLLKDIFPQNAVDLGMFSKSSPIYWWFRKKEIALYITSDFIGCMSPANVEFIKKHNPYIRPKQVEIAPNSIEPQSVTATINKEEIKKKYNLPTNVPVFIYGGNLGRPQGVEFLIHCLEANNKRKDCHFLIVGNGTEYSKIRSWYETCEPTNTSLLAGLPKDDYDQLVQSCDVGLIFLDRRFTIPNYPSRLLSYLEYEMPIIAATDTNTDIGSIAEANGYGYWCESVNPEDFTDCVDKMLASDYKEMGKQGHKFLKKNYLVEHTYNAIFQHLKKTIQV